jgi:hypothetical protein
LIWKPPFVRAPPLDSHGLVGTTVRVPDRAWPGYENTRTISVRTVLAYAAATDEYVVTAGGEHYAFTYALLTRYDKAIGKRTAQAAPATGRPIGRRAGTRRA